MNKRASILFLLLVLSQALHSIEEYIGELWLVLPPAKFLCSLISSDLETGFLVINTGLFVFGILCWVFRNSSIVYTTLIWFWIIIELINGIGHPVWALMERDYVPGLITAPLLLILSVLLLRNVTAPQHSER